MQLIRQLRRHLLLPEQGQNRPTALKIQTQYIAVSSSGKRRTLAFSPTPPARKPRPMHRAEFCCVSCISFISCKGDFFNLAFLSLIRYRLFLRLLLLWQLLFLLFRVR